MKRKATILGQVRDVEGGLWDVRDLRDTKYGFDTRATILPILS